VRCSFFCLCLFNFPQKKPIKHDKARSLAFLPPLLFVRSREFLFFLLFFFKICFLHLLCVTVHHYFSFNFNFFRRRLAQTAQDMNKLAATISNIHTSLSLRKCVSVCHHVHRTQDVASVRASFQKWRLDSLWQVEIDGQTATLQARCDRFDYQPDLFIFFNSPCFEFFVERMLMVGRMLANVFREKRIALTMTHAANAMSSMRETSIHSAFSTWRQNALTQRHIEENHHIGSLSLARALSHIRRANLASALSVWRSRNAVIRKEENNAMLAVVVNMQSRMVDLVDRAEDVDVSRKMNLELSRKIEALTQSANWLDSMGGWEQLQARVRFLEAERESLVQQLREWKLEVQIERQNAHQYTRERDVERAWLEIRTFVNAQAVRRSFQAWLRPVRQGMMFRDVTGLVNGLHTAIDIRHQRLESAIARWQVRCCVVQYPTYSPPLSFRCTEIIFKSIFTECIIQFFPLHSLYFILFLFFFGLQFHTVQRQSRCQGLSTALTHFALMSRSDLISSFSHWRSVARHEVVGMLSSESSLQSELCQTMQMRMEQMAEKIEDVNHLKAINAHLTEKITQLTWRTSRAGGEQPKEGDLRALVTLYKSGQEKAKRELVEAVRDKDIITNRWDEMMRSMQSVRLELEGEKRFGMRNRRGLWKSLDKIVV
jgi:hypothetical protein